VRESPPVFPTTLSTDTHHNSPEGSMRCGQHTFRSDNNEDRVTCFSVVLSTVDIQRYLYAQLCIE